MQCQPVTGIKNDLSEQRVSDDPTPCLKKNIYNGCWFGAIVIPYEYGSKTFYHFIILSQLQFV